MGQTESKESKKSHLARLVARCGPALHLFPDALLLAKNFIDHHPAAWQALATVNELRRSAIRLRCEPLMTALAEQAADAAFQCRHCQPSDPLTVIYGNFSGSSAEGLTDNVLDKGGRSDLDIMFEFGAPLRWAAGAEEDCISPEAAPQLCAKPSSSPGFVTLHWAKTSRCSHEDPVALPADTIRQLMWNFCRANYPGDNEITRPGPAVNVRPPECTTGGFDHVPCLRLRWWPEAEDFLARHRETSSSRDFTATDFPPMKTRKDICSFGVHLVPTGCPGSATKDVEYRVSFSRAEVVTIRLPQPGAARHCSHRERAEERAKRR